MKLFIFASTLNAGSDSFFRNDFIKAILEMKIKNSVIERAVAALNASSKRWRYIARALRYAQRGEIGKVDILLVGNKLKEIGKIELEAVRTLLDNFNIFESYYDMEY